MALNIAISKGSPTAVLVDLNHSSAAWPASISLFAD